MLADYVSAGLPPDQFWRITLRELSAHMEGAKRRLDREHKLRAWLAHTTAALSGIPGKKFPPLESLTKEPQRQSVDHMMAIAERWDKAINRRVS